MKILFVNMAPIIIYGLGQAFSDLGHEVKYINIDFDESLVNAIDEFQPDFVFNDGGIDRMHKLFPLLSERQVPHIYWAIEDPTSYHLSIPYAMQSAIVFTPCKESLDEYSRLGVTAQLLMFACHPRFHYRAAPDHRYQHELVFIGNNYDYHLARNQGINNVLKPAIENFDTKIYGNEWWLDKNKDFHISSLHYGGYLPNEYLPVVCASSQIVLGVHSITDSETMMSMRSFEILGSAGFYLTQWTKAIECQFKNHYHLVWSRSKEETLDLIRFYLARPELRKKIAEQGQKEVYSQHTYHIRIKNIENILEQAGNLKAARAHISYSNNGIRLKCQKASSIIRP